MRRIITVVQYCGERGAYAHVRLRARRGQPSWRRAVAAGADGLLLWGAVDNATTTTVALQSYVDATLGPEVELICREYGCVTSK